MAFKIRIAAVAMIVAILICSATLLSTTSGKSIKPVEEASMTKSDASSITVSWEKVSHADGYKIFSVDESGKQTLMKDIADPKTTSAKISKLEDGQSFTLCMTAYRYYHKNQYESEVCEPFKAYTKPAAPEIRVNATEPKKLSIAWNEIKSATGYILEYSTDESFSQAEKKELEKTSITVDNLKPKDVYFARCRAYKEIDGKKVYSAYSEVDSAKIRNKIVMSKQIDPDKPMVALSFDDGPAYYVDNKNTTSQILDVLEDYNARATFFMVASRIDDSNSNILKREIELGCELGNHTIKHTHYGSKVTASDISKASKRIEKYSGKAPTAFRCPGGILTGTIKKECASEGMVIAYWSVDTEDWKSKDENAIYRKVMNNVYDGSIILMHDIYPSTAKAVKKVVPKLIEKGYQVVSVSELIEYKTGAPAKAGEQYVDYKTINNNT